MAGVGTYSVTYRIPRPLRERIQNGELAKVVNDWVKEHMATMGFQKVRIGKRQFWFRMDDLE